MMRNIIMLFTMLLCLPVFGQPEKTCSTTEFRQVADSMQMTIKELCDYPVIFPVRNPTVSSGYGMRRHPVYNVRKLHAGVDFAGVKGTPVHAAGNGVVIRKGYDRGYGNFIEIRHAGGFRSFYAHLSKTLVNTGDSVNIGKYIARMGDTGIVTGAHLHYEIRKGNRFLNPAEWCYCLLAIILKEETI